jgi:hypothetical protein
MKNLLFISVVTFVFIFAGCSQQKTETNSAKQSTENQNILGMDMKTVKVDFRANPAEVEAGRNTDLLFTVKNGKGEIIRDLQNVHEKPMHLLVVSDDLDEFYHLHPEVQSDGVYKASFAFPNGGNYKLYTDFTPLDSEQIVQNFPLRVSGNERAAKELKPDEKFEKTVDNLRIVLKSDGDLTSIKEMMLDFQVYDAQTNKPIVDLENYLGAKAHFVVISQDLQEFVHAHPVSRDNVKTDEHAHDSMNGEMNGKVSQTSTGGHQHDSKLAGQDAESIVSAHVTFPKPAIYKIFAQFQRNGKVITVPFVIDVKKAEDEKAVDLKNAVIPEGAFKIVVSKDGFTPQEISYKQGQPLKLAFYRADKENCGSEVIFKDLNIKKKLPVGKVVLVDIPTDNPGEFAFACGMDMLKGKIVVQ